MRLTRFRLSTRFAASLGAVTLIGAGPAHAQIATSVTVDDFEHGVGDWTCNDKNKASGGAVSLADIVPTSPGQLGHPLNSKGAALVAFKSGDKSWASISRPIDGADWAKVGGQRLTFYVDAGGETPGVNLQLRGRYKNAAGGTTEIAFSPPHPIRLDILRWHKVVIPFTDFKGPKGEPLDGKRLYGLYLLQFSQTGTWGSRFFTLDDIQVEGNGVPIPPPAAPTPPPVSMPAPSPSPTTAPAGGIKVNADFLRLNGSIRASGNATVVAAESGTEVLPIDSSTSYRQYLALLHPRFIRIDAASLSQVTNSAGPTFDFSKLQTATARARSVGAEPLISLRNPSDWGLDPRGYAAFATGAAAAVNQRGISAKYFELAAVDTSLDATSAAGYYNAGYIALKAASANFKVGGHGADAGDEDSVKTLLQGAKGLDFLAINFFGADETGVSDSALLQSAREVKSLKMAAGLLDKSRFRNSALFITAANLNGAKNAGENTPSDARTQGMIAAAWWAQFLASGSRLADQVFQNDSVNPEWGFMIPVGNEYRAYPAYYSIWLWNTYFPSGSTRVAAGSSSPDIFVAAANTPTAHNLLVVNNTDQEQTAQISIRGFPILREARLRLFDDPQKSVSLTPLPKSPFQTVKLAPYAIAVIQFIEPPKKH